MRDTLIESLLAWERSQGVAEVMLDSLWDNQIKIRGHAPTPEQENVLDGALGALMRNIAASMRVLKDSIQQCNRSLGLEEHDYTPYHKQGGYPNG